ncbi:MAG: 8-amino-7-oxononanoate synthase [Mariprofundaceae bacterium]|nr:8-amino-7-oxononanoate synthase [Mariprofundaceae bacterium]
MMERDNTAPHWWQNTAAHSRRRLPATQQDGVHINLADRTLINFSSNDYLGLRQHASVISTATHYITKHGLGSGASRYISGDDPAFAQLERDCAEWKGAQACLLVGSGMLGNIGLLQALATRHSDIFADRLNHASLLDGARLSRAHLHRYAHRDMAALESLLQRSSSDQRIIVSDGVFSMDGDEADVGALIALCERYDAWLVLDDAHGNGCIGAQGAGLTAEAGVQGHSRLIECGTFGKALGGYGAFMVASTAVIEGLIQRLRTAIYSTALPPAMAKAMSVALEALRKTGLRQQLQGNIQSFLALNQDLPLLPSRTPIQPLWMGTDEAALHASAQLRDAGFFVPAIRPPTVPQGASRLRITLSALHTAAHIAALSEALHKL